MRRFILTGAPGSGKTAILRQLELDGYSVVEEAATDVIAVSQARGIEEPWKNSSFLDQIAALQRDRRQRNTCPLSQVQFHDRSPLCTAALAAYLEFPISPFLTEELERIRTEGVYQKQVFFIRNLGFITNTDARRITFEDTLRFERIHEQTYRDLGFNLIFIEPANVLDRVNKIKSLIP